MHRVNSASLLITASVVAVDPAGLWPFGPLRWLVVSTLGICVCAICLQRPTVRLDRRTRLLWVVLLVCLSLSALTNGDVWIALVGTDTRHFGLATWLLCCGLFYAGQQLRGYESVLVRAASVSVLAIGLWCAWEALFGPPIALGIDSSRLTGPFGSAALLGGAMCLLLPVAVALTIDRNASRAWRICAATSSALGLIATIGSGARAAWAGLFVAAAVVAWKIRKTRRSLAIVGSGLIVVVLLSLPFIGSVFERSHGASSRIDEWRVATRVIAEHPLLGVGPEGYRIAVSEGVDAEYERAYPRDSVLPDRAHSSLLDVALAGGLAAAVAYAGLLIVIGRRVVGRVALGSASQVALMASVTAYFSAQFLLFPVFELDPIAWLLAGVVVASAVPARRRAEMAVHLKTATAALVALALMIVGVLDVAANRVARDAITSSAIGDDDAARESAERATRLRPDSIAYRMIATQVLLAADTVTATDAALSHATAALDWSRHDPIAVDLWASSLLQRAFQTGDAIDGRAALAAWEELVGRDPNRARWQLQLGKAAALLDEVEVARHAWQRAAALGSHEAEQLLKELP